jgi:hypothetical protein
VIFKQASAGGSGIYYLTAGGLNAKSADLIMDPTTNGGIMLYNAGTGTNDGINIAGNFNGYVNLSGPTNGIYTGLTFFQARNAPEDVQIAGNGSFNIRDYLCRGRHLEGHGQWRGLEHRLPVRYSGFEYCGRRQHGHRLQSPKRGPRA